MTMLDEDILRNALEEFADSLDVPDDGVEKILQAASASMGLPPLPRPSDFSFDDGLEATRRRVHKSRMPLVAALVALAAIGTGIGCLAAFTGTSNSQSATPTTVNFSRAPGLPVQLKPESKSSSATVNGNNPGGVTSTSAKPTAPKGTPAKVVATGTVNLTVKDGTVDSVLSELTSLASSDDGFVASTHAQLSSAHGMSPSGTIVLRVPEGSFASLVTAVQRYGHPTYVNTNSNDVTGQYVDLQAQITALQASEQQYLSIMQRAGTIPDVLQVQNQISNIETQIQQLQGQLNVLDNEIAYSTLTVSLNQPAKKTPPPPVKHKSSGLTSALRGGVGGFVSGFEWFLRIAGPTLFALIALAVLVLLGRRAWRFLRRQMI
jgi:Domain of unknown function (DUF4349)